MIQPFVLFTKATSICKGVAVAVSDGLSPSMASSAAVHCLLAQHYGSTVTAYVVTGPDQWRATVKTFTRGKSVLESTLTTALGTETLMVIQAGIQCLV